MNSEGCVCMFVCVILILETRIITENVVSVNCWGV